jgi:hypothetical protein
LTPAAGSLASTPPTIGALASTSVDSRNLDDATTSRSEFDQTRKGERVVSAAGKIIEALAVEMRSRRSRKQSEEYCAAGSCWLGGDIARRARREARQDHLSTD